jgi:hypothetical protein
VAHHDQVEVHVEVLAAEARSKESVVEVVAQSAQSRSMIKSPSMCAAWRVSSLVVAVFHFLLQ